MEKKFQRKIEDFTCEHCHAAVKGTGYTNHCPKCLWSKHVDVNPGDRAELCRGLMEPVGALQKKGEYYIVHQCERCGFERQKKLQEGDDFEALLALMKSN